MNDFAALKKFGQNYLADKNILKKISDEIAPSANDILLEIGPGYGALTEFLIKNCPDMTAVEIDTRVIKHLEDKFSGIKIINQDILKFDFNSLLISSVSKIRVAGNIPYNLTSPILFKLIENRSIINDAVFLVQDEVARRINAVKNTKEYGILAVVLQYFCSVKYCFKVSPNVFIPKPKVFSAVIHLNFKTDVSQEVSGKLFIQIVKACFGNRRKTLKNSLSNSIFKDVDFFGCPVDLSHRAEQLTIDDFVELTRFVSIRLK
jgi:16S rRNA (adenine1518-N6/adenine1519-N6)-dimethyltransferase